MKMNSTAVAIAASLVLGVVWLGTELVPTLKLIEMTSRCEEITDSSQAPLLAQTYIAGKADCYKVTQSLGGIFVLQN